MNTQMLQKPRNAWRALATLLLLGAGAANAQMVSQNPLSVGGGVPGNMVLTPSVEFPTLNSKANIISFNAITVFTGYFDPYKCYKYSYDATEANRYFYPVRVTTLPAVCSAASKEWSGNWLNWATTQTIDPFRKALTGGYRVKDTATETWLEKARHDGQGGIGYFPIATITSTATISGAIPSAAWATLRSRVVGGNSEMWFTSSPTATDLTNVVVGSTVAYNPATHTLDNSGANPSTYYRVSVRVKVCDSSVGVEPNCVQYPSGWKPEGLIQKYQRKIRFSVFGYLLDNGAYRDGGVLRANQKFVGPQFLDKADGLWKTNPYREWDDNGVFINNPNPADASATEALVNGATVTKPIVYSGVINYINRFAQLTGTNAKNYDPVSELYYTAFRYLRGKTNVPSYSRLDVRYDTAAGTATTVGTDRFNLTDGFPVITRWEDPYEYSCQSSAILGIGDVYTHKDKNLKGNTVSSGPEPTMPSEVSSDPMMSLSGNATSGTVVEWTQRAYAIEGVAYTNPLNTGLNNSPYMVGLAYYAHTQDLRPEAALPGKQTASTHWVDVREVQKIEPRVRNQYWMAAKYGGFAVPDDYNALTNTTALPNNWWSTTGDNITSNSTDWTNETFRRASNYYVADKPSTMVDSLTRAFAKIVAERSGTGSALAANSTRLDTDTRAYQAQFRSGVWLGQLSSFSFDTNLGTLSSTPSWKAGEKMPAWASRNIKVNTGSSMAAFTYANLSATQKTSMDALNGVLAVTGSDIVDYIRGNQAKEESASTGTLRTRTSPEPGWSAILGDIVNSAPVYVGAPKAGLWSKAPGTWAGKSTYDAFATSNATRTPVVWVGANDGMLHAFNATEGQTASGAEIFAFIPKTAIANGLVNVADPDYEHRYFVDGDLAVSDVYDGTSWKTILVGTMGRGSPGAFALDVTNPAAPTFLWEKNLTDIPSLGHNIGRPVIAQIADGDWRVLFGNGPDSAGGTAKLIAIGALSGTVTVYDTDSTTSNGLSAVTARDNNADGLFETVYAGDLNGSLWKITGLTGTGSALQLFAATDGSLAQPITAAPEVGKDPKTGFTWVWFGTGKYLRESDMLNTQMQTWYGIIDNNALVNRSELVQRVTAFAGVNYGFGTRTVTEATSGDMTGQRGWFINLPESGERMVVPNLLTGIALVGTTRTPTGRDACSPSGTGWLMAIDPFTGARLPKNFFDISRDKLFNAADNTGTNEINSGIQFGSPPTGPTSIPPVICTPKDDGTVECIRVSGGSAEAKRASWREITN